MGRLEAFGEVGGLGAALSDMARVGGIGRTVHRAMVAHPYQGWCRQLAGMQPVMAAAWAMTTKVRCEVWLRGQPVGRRKPAASSTAG